jgi:hypothetical protein
LPLLESRRLIVLRFAQCLTRVSEKLRQTLEVDEEERVR